MHKIKRFSCLDQYLAMAFAQLTYRESLRDIEACLRMQSSKLYHLGFRSVVVAYAVQVHAKPELAWNARCWVTHGWPPCTIIDAGAC